MRRLQWILHGEKDSLNALDEMKLVPLRLSAAPSRAEAGKPHRVITKSPPAPSSMATHPGSATHTC